MNEPALAIFGDVHGEATALRTALDAYVGRRPVLLVGDYVNRGSQSAEVLDLIVAASEHGEVTALMGNHDYAFIRYIADGSLSPFARMGGLATIYSYTGAVSGQLHSSLLAAIPPSHLALLENLGRYYEDESLVVSHCGVPPRHPKDRTFEQLVLRSHPELFGPENTHLPKTVVSGHYAQRKGKPFVSGKYICVDSGCGTIPGAPLTVLDWPEREFHYFEVQ